MVAKQITALNFPALLHGADYNPEQWLNQPEILKQDIQMMKQAHCNVMSVGIFSWSMLEPAEGQYNFGWLDDVLNTLAQNEISVFLATPSGARPAWLSAKYPQVLRVDEQRRHALHGGRHNHCLSSPIYREKVRAINQQLAKRYAHHPAVIGWHISNEYGGQCHCPLCQEQFRLWLKNKYQTLDALNQAWWSNFWSHTFTDWSQIESPSSIGENSIHGLNLDWKRFTTAQVINFCQHEIDSVRPFNPELPVTTNFMEYFYDYDYWELAKILDFVCWDNYPLWHGERSDRDTGAYVGMYHDLIRSLKPGQPFLLMESTPSATNWQPTSKLKKPGMHILSSMQAIAHGSNSVQYFQWRKSRGSVEKFHGAVVDHVGHINTRVGKEVTQLGEILSKLSEITTTTVKAEVAILFDWDNRWAMDNAQGPRNKGLFYEQTVNSHYLPFWEMGINVDIVNQQSDLSAYKLVIAPMSYMVKPAFAKELDRFVSQGGCLVSTYWSGIVQEHDLCFLGGFPGPLKPILGIWSEEIDSLDDHESNWVQPIENNSLSLTGPYKATQLCDLIHLQSASALAYYQQDFYQGYPALTVNHYGKGLAYYIASKNDEQFQYDFTKALVQHLQITPAIATTLPEAVTAQVRENDQYRYIFIQNFNNATVKFDLPNSYKDALDDSDCQGQLALPPFAVKVLKESKQVTK
ncbi:beta-galactosidase [Celerinatantimonas sp. MCCC 1A17872]|uniref:beta-galactosidase n=1 Tax=Celerinatantimonas sp. MCCC 1A17872 TaxID=3177514 RepID=UPI0038C6AA95